MRPATPATPVKRLSRTAALNRNSSTLALFICFWRGQLQHCQTWLQQVKSCARPSPGAQCALRDPTGHLLVRKYDLQWQFHV